MSDIVDHLDVMRYTDAGAPWLHVYAQSHEHSRAIIRGKVEALRALRDALEKAIEAGQAEAQAFCHDGEGYAILCQRVNLNGLLGPLPYSGEDFSEMREEFYGNPIQSIKRTGRSRSDAEACRQYLPADLGRVRPTIRS